MKYNCSDYRSADMQILMHHIYEYKKGIRNMVLHTMKSEETHKAKTLLQNRGIIFYIQQVNERKINVFFGNTVCVNVIKSIGDKSLKDYTPEEDFILGTMLGYSRLQQCKRYVTQKSTTEIVHFEEKIIESNN